VNEGGCNKKKLRNKEKKNKKKTINLKSRAHLEPASNKENGKIWDLANPYVQRPKTA
jgi:hypothetical protein